MQYPPPSSIALSELSSTVSALQETIATQGRLLAENLNDPASADMNRDITRTGSARGKNERAPVGDRE